MQHVLHGVYCKDHSDKRGLAIQRTIIRSLRNCPPYWSWFWVVILCFYLQLVMSVIRQSNLIWFLINSSSLFMIIFELSIFRKLVAFTQQKLPTGLKGDKTWSKKFCSFLLNFFAGPQFPVGYFFICPARIFFLDSSGLRVSYLPKKGPKPNIGQH